MSAVPGEFENLKETVFDESVPVIRRVSALKSATKLQDTRAPALVVEACLSGKTEVRRAARQLMGKTLQRIRALLVSDDAKTRRHAAEALAKMAEALAAPVQQLAERDPDDQVRRAAAEALTSVPKPKLSAAAQPDPPPRAVPTVPKEAVAPKARDTKQADTGLWSILRTDRDAGMNKQIAQTVARVTGGTVFDAMRAITAAPGFAAREVDRETAQAVVEMARQSAVLLIPVSDGELAPQPDLARATAYVASEEGIQCEVVSSGQTETLSFAWDSVVLVVCGRLLIGKMEPIRVDVRRLFRTVQDERLVTVTNEYLVADLFAGSPIRRIRFGGEQPDLSFVPGQNVPPPAIDVRELANTILRIKPGIRVNEAGFQLATGGPEARVQSLSFTSKAEFDAYCHWLLQLATMGRGEELTVV